MTATAYKKISCALLFLFAAGFAFILINFWQRLVFPEDFRMFEYNGNENLSPGQPIAEKFTALEDRLTQVNILMDNFEKILPEDTLAVSILDADCRETLRAAVHAWPAHSPKQFDRFTFAPLLDSKNKTYCLTIRYDAPVKRKSRPAVAKMKNTGVLTDQFVILTSGKVYPGETLIFRPTYAKATTGETLAELIRRMSAYKANFLQGKFLLLVIGLFLGATALLGGLLLLSPEKENSKEEGFSLRSSGRKVRL